MTSFKLYSRVADSGLTSVFSQLLITNSVFIDAYVTTVLDTALGLS